MTSRKWLLLLLPLLLIAVASVAPFLPGSGNGFSHGMSQFAQITEYLVTGGTIWPIEAEIPLKQSITRVYGD